MSQLEALQERWHYNTTFDKWKEKGSTIYSKSNRGKMLDYNEENEDSLDELENIVGNKTKTGRL